MFTDQCNERQVISQCFKDDVSDGKTTITSYVLRDGKKNPNTKKTTNQTHTHKKPNQPTKPNPNIKTILTAWPCISPYLKPEFVH